MMPPQEAARQAEEEAEAHDRKLYKSLFAELKPDPDAEADEAYIRHAAKNEALSNVWKWWVIRRFNAGRCSVLTRSRHPSMAL